MSDALIASLKRKLHEASGTDRIRHEDWFIATFASTGFVEELSRNGAAMEQASKRLTDAAHFRCHEVAWRYWSTQAYDWWMGLALGVVEGEWSWFFHSWLTAIGRTDERIEASTSTPKLYFGVQVRSLSQQMTDALSRDPPTA